MKIAYVSRTLHSGLPEKMAMAVNQYTSHEAVALVPGTWMDGKRQFLPGERTPLLWNVNDPEQRDHVLENAEVIHTMYNSSIHDLGRSDLEGKKLCVWHLATRWHSAFERLFPSGIGRTRLVLSAEGWDRYGLGPWKGWTQVPVIFLLDHPAYQPIDFARRTRHASMSIRVKLDTTDDGRPIAAPRSSKKVAEALKGLKFRRIHGLDFQTCMRRKATAWIGIDDVVNPLVHQSSFEYLALGVPCVNGYDLHLWETISAAYGATQFPFWPADGLEDVRRAVSIALSAKSPQWKRESDNMRAWMLAHAHPCDTIARYVDLYNGARVA